MAGTTTIFREFKPTLRLALPIVAGHVGQILLGLVDSIMIGRVGAVPLAASAFAGAVFGMVYVISIGLLTAIAVRAAVAHGAGKRREAAEVLRHGFVTAVGAAVAAAAGLHILAGHLHLFGQPADVAAAAGPYLAIIGWSLVPGLAFLSLKQYYEALHRPWVPFFWVMGGVLLNACLNWVMIYGNLGAPALGLVGAGWATLIARAATLAGLTGHLVCAGAMSAARPVRWTARLRWPEFRALTLLGGPVALQLCFEVGLFTAAAVIMGWLGTVALAAHQIALSCASTTFMFPLGISQALSVRIGHARGAGRPHEVRAIGFGGIGAGALIMVCFALVFLVGGRWLAAGFIPDPEVVALAARLLVVAGVFQIFDGTQVTSIGALRGLTDVRAPTAITFLGYWVVAFPAAWLLGFPAGFDAVGVWSGLALGLALCAVLLLTRFAVLTAPRRNAADRGVTGS